MKQILTIILCSLFFLGCKESKKQMLIKKWQAVGFENPELNKQISESRVFFDTIGKSTDAATNEKLYGVRNMDSMRAELKMQLDSFMSMQENTVKNTWLDFKKDGTVIANFGSDPDTVKWYFDDDGNLMLDELAQKGAGSKIKMEMVQISDTLLELRFNENGFSSLARFRPAK